MNTVLWIVQTLLAVHTAIGALWKFKHSERTVPSLAIIPHPVWLGIAVVELGCGMGLLLPALDASWNTGASVAAAIIGLEMMAFCALHLRSNNKTLKQMAYWLVVAGVCAFVAYSRL